MNRISLLGIAFCLTMSACASEHWVGVPVGVAHDDRNAMDALAGSNPSLGMKNASLGEAGVSLGGRTKPFLGILRWRTELYGLASRKRFTSDAVGEYTGSAQQLSLGCNFGFYVTDFFYFYVNPIPYTNFIYTSGAKIRPLPGRTTDLARAWDAGVSAGAAFEVKLKRFSLGVEWRDISVIAGALGPDSSGFGYDNHYFGLIAKYWY